MSGTSFDEYISLGNRCETAFQIQRVLGKDGLHPSFFNWNVTYIDSLISLLSTRFEGILNHENLTPNEWLVHDSVGDYYFHLIGEGRKSKDHPSFTSDMESHRNKVNHILDKFFSLARSGRRVCYFYRIEDNRDMLKNARRVSDLLERIHENNPFALVFIQNEEARRPSWGDTTIFNRYVKRFAPNEDQGDAHIPSWDAIFREFPHSGKMNLCYWL